MTNIQKAQQLAAELNTILQKEMGSGGAVQSMVIEGLLKKAQELETSLGRLQHSIEIDAGGKE